MQDAVTRIVRTVAAYVWAWLALRLAEWLGVSFDVAQTAAIQEAIVIVLGAVIYGLIATFGKRWPWLEWLLVRPTPPVYRSNRW